MLNIIFTALDALSRIEMAKRVLEFALEKVNSWEVKKQENLKAQIDEKVKSGWGRAEAEISVLWENNEIEDDEFQMLIKALEAGIK